MNVTKYIKKLCESRNVQYEDITHTFYYKAFFDLYNNGYYNIDNKGNIVVDEDKLIKRARRMAINRAFSDDATYNDRLEYLTLIFERGSDEVVDTAMSIIAESSDIEEIPISSLYALYNMAISDSPVSNKELAKIYAESINKEYTNYDKHEERWEIPFYHNLVLDSSIRNNNYQEYMSVLDDMPPAQYTDAATIICPFTNQTSYSKGADRRGIFCKVPFTEGIILDPQTNSIRYRLSKYITDVSEVGLRPKLKIDPNNVPKNKGYIQTDERITEYGYWPKTIVSGKLSDYLDIALEEHELKEVGDITTELLITGGRVIPNRVRCFEYRGELYALLPTRFKTGVAGPIMLSDRNSYNPIGALWTKIEPLKCYVDKKSGQLITADIIVSGIDKDFIEKYINLYFAESLHKFDDFFKNRKPEEVEFSEERKAFIKQISHMLSTIQKDAPTNNQSEDKKQQSQTNSSKNVDLIQAIDSYLEFNKSDIQISQVDDYIRIVNSIINQLESTEGINEDTINSLRKLIKPLEVLNNPENRIRRILNEGPAVKIADGEASLIIVRQLIPKTDQIVQILCQKYKSKHDDQDRASNKVEELKQARNQYRELSDNTYKSIILDADSYKMQDSLHRLIESASSFISDESLKTLLNEKIKPLDDVLDPNNRINSVLLSSYIPTQIQEENTNLIEATVTASRLLKPILDVIYEENNIEEAYIKKEPTQTERKDFFDGITSFFSSIIPNWGAAKGKILEATGSTKKTNTNRKAYSKKPIKSATIEEALPILDQFSSESREKDLKALQAIISSKDVSFDMGKIDDLVFLILKDQRDSSTHIFTNNPKIGYFEIASKEGTICNSTIYKNNYWIGQERHIMDYKQENRIPPIREINYAIKRFDGIIERDVQSDTYNESSDIVTIRIGNTPFSGKYSRDYDKLMKKGINEETLNAIKSNISDVIPPYIVEILQKYSPEIANDIQLGDRIFHDY